MPDGGNPGAGVPPGAAAGRAQPGGGVSYGFEKLIDLLCYDDLARITREHWQAIALNRREVPLTVDWEAYLAAERAGTWRAFTARGDDGKLLGYIAFNYHLPIRYRTTLYIHEDTIWVIPEAGTMRRALIWRSLWREALAALPRPAVVYGKVRLTETDAKLLRNTIGKRIGAKRALFLAVGLVMRSLGMEPVEMVFCKVLK